MHYCSLANDRYNTRILLHCVVNIIVYGAAKRHTPARTHTQWQNVKTMYRIDIALFNRT